MRTTERPNGVCAIRICIPPPPPRRRAIAQSLWENSTDMIWHKIFKRWLVSVVMVRWAACYNLTGLQGDVNMSQYNERHRWRSGTGGGGWRWGGVMWRQRSKWSVQCAVCSGVVCHMCSYVFGMWISRLRVSASCSEFSLRECRINTSGNIWVQFNWVVLRLLAFWGCASLFLFPRIVKINRHRTSIYCLTQNWNFIHFHCVDAGC